MLLVNHSDHSLLIYPGEALYCYFIEQGVNKIIFRCPHVNKMFVFFGLKDGEVHAQCLFPQYRFHQLL